MKEDILEKIISTERQIQERIQKEILKTEEWLKEIRNKAEIEIKTEEETQRKLLEQWELDIEIELKKEAEILIENVRGYGEKLLSINDSILKELLKRHLRKILPPL
jgi:hypothetical protein